MATHLSAPRRQFPNSWSTTKDIELLRSLSQCEVEHNQQFLEQSRLRQQKVASTEALNSSFMDDYASLLLAGPPLLLFLLTLYALTADFADICRSSPICQRYLQPTLSFYVLRRGGGHDDAMLMTDIADAQWRGFREKLPLLVALAVTHTGIGITLRHLSAADARTAHGMTITYDLMSGLALIAYVHRAQALHLIAFAACNYAVGKWCGAAHVQLGAKRSASLASICSWALLLAVLLLRQYGRQRLKFGALFGAEAAGFLDRDVWGGMGWWDHANLLALRMLSFNVDRAAALASVHEAGREEADKSGEEKPASSSGSFSGTLHDSGVDGAATAAASAASVASDASVASAGALPAALATSEAAAAASAAREEDEQAQGQEQEATEITEDGGRRAHLLPASQYGWREYLAYIFYPPLYVAGPILTANAFLCQQRRLAAAAASRCRRRRRPTMNTAAATVAASFSAPPALILNALRWLAALCALEALASRAPCFALARAQLLHRLTAAQSLGFSYLALKLVWLKFVVIWRLFRLWAMADGRLPPENLPRCMSNHYRALAFWRSWHQSFNQWLVCYLYLPLGGRRRRLRNTAAVFAFVGLWHGVELQMALWSCLVVLFLLTEVWLLEPYSRRLLHAEEGGGSVGGSPPARDPARARSVGRWYDRHVVAALGACSIASLILANLVGFTAAGNDAEALADLATRLLASRDGLVAGGAAWLFLFAGVQIMIDLETRRRHRDR